MTVYSSFEQIPAKIKYEKFSEKIGVCHNTSAFSSEDTLTLTVRVPRCFCADGGVLRLYVDGNQTLRTLPLEPDSGFYPDCDKFSVTFKAADICLDGKCGLFYYTFGIDTVYGRLYTSKYGDVSPDQFNVPNIQLTVYEEGFATPDKFKGGMMYQIFVDRFYWGKEKIQPDENKILNNDWENGTPQFAGKPGGFVANNMFFGGNLWGVAEKLDYIASLGVDTLYLCPVFDSASNHKYDTGDYMKIDRMFGGEEAFDNLISELDKRGMKLILDGVFNHTGSDSKYFNKYRRYEGDGAYNSKESPYYDWYDFENYPDKYRCWWGIDILPAVNSRNPSYLEFMHGENGVIRHYLKKGLSGWRLDVADELSDEFLDRLRTAAKTEKPDSLIIGEVWEDASNKIAYSSRRRYFQGKQLDSVMNYPLKVAVINFILTKDNSQLVEVSKELYSHYPKEVSDVLMNFLGTHDTERILSVLADVDISSMKNSVLAEYRLPQEVRQKAVERLKLAWATLAAFPGIPCIYYGDEAGMEGGHDPFNRMPYIWGKEDKSLVEFYRRVGKVRRSENAFAKGDFKIIETFDKGKLLFTRDNIAVAVNLTDEAWEIEFDTVVQRLLSDDKCGGKICEVKAGSVEYFRL